MDEEDKQNQELYIVGQAFLHTGISKVQDLLQNYINLSEQYNDSYSIALLNKIKEDIANYIDNEEKDIEQASKSIESPFYMYSGKIIKVFDKSLQCGFCIKKDYINNDLVAIEGMCLDFRECQITEIDEKECNLVEELYCEFDNKLYQLAIKEFRNRDYGKVLYEDIKNKFIVVKKEEIDETIEN